MFRCKTTFNINMRKVSDNNSLTYMSYHTYNRLRFYFQRPLGQLKYLCSLTSMTALVIVDGL